MKKIILISCASKKINKKIKAQDLYISALFQKNLQYAKSLNPDKIFILSAKYGLLKLDKEVEPYDKTLNRMRSYEIKEWANSVLSQLQKVVDLNKDEFVFLAGDNYRKFLLPRINNYKIPMLGLGIGKQLKWLKEKIKVSEICHTIHQWFNARKIHYYHQMCNAMEKHSLSQWFNEQEIPKNGIYILFEKGECAHSTDRIVRIGTHTGKNKLRSRLKEHLNENKDRSIFRKNIGRALLNKDNDPFIEQWNKNNLTKKNEKALDSNSVEFIKQKEIKEKVKEIEKRVTKYILDNISFVTFQIDDKDKRLELESKIISTVSRCDECKTSSNWLGLSSPKEKIRKSGLWLVNELCKTPLSEDDLKELKNILENAGYSNEWRSKLLISKYQGCLLGLAIGDALGAPVEFLRLPEIKNLYGKDGITDFYEWRGFKPGSYTDDTQMSLATAIGCIRACQRWRDRGICHSASVVHRRYLEWLESQNDLGQRRGPGNTCLRALQSGKMGTIEEKINDSKGCGGVMRTAPVGLAFPPDRAFQEGAEYAAITHGHPSGYLTAGFLSGMISYIIEGKTLAEAIDLCIGQLTRYDGYSETLEKIELAQKLSVSQKPPEESIHAIGEGWVGEEALAISLYCSLKFSDNFERGILAAVNHSGDSDSTGSITGAILGTLLGVESIPNRWVENVEDSIKIQKIANDMFRIFKNGEELSFEEYPPF